MGKHSESIDSMGLIGGSGWTRTTDLTLISSENYFKNLIKSILSDYMCARVCAQLPFFVRDNTRLFRAHFNT